MARKIIIDTDPGIDDAIAIALALRSPELDVIGLTTVYGNHEVAVCTANALYLLEVEHRTDTPVADGAAGPLSVPYAGPVPFIHGEHGLGDHPKARPSTSPTPRHAADFIREAAGEHPGEVSIVPIGPLTNLAIAVDRHPDLPGLVDEVVVMGGNAYTKGNASPAAEANILNDPEAADIVFGQDWKITMVGLDVTEQVILSPGQIEAIAAGRDPIHRLLADAMAFYRRFHESFIPGYSGLCPHDATALTYLLRPDLFETQDRPVRVELEGLGRGKTWPADRHHTGNHAPWADRPNVTIPIAVDGAAVAAYITERTAGDQGLRTED